MVKQIASDVVHVPWKAVVPSYSFTEHLFSILHIFFFKVLGPGQRAQLCLHGP